MNYIHIMSTEDELRKELHDCVPPTGYSGFPGSFYLLEKYMGYKDRVNSIIWRASFLKFVEVAKEATEVKVKLIDNIQGLLS